MHDAVADNDSSDDGPTSSGADGVAAPPAAVRPRRTGLLLMLFVLVLVIVAGIVWAVVAAVDKHPDRDASGQLIEAGSLSVSELQVGDCFQQDDDPTALTVARFIQAVPCSDAHDAEVYAEDELADPAGTQYPGEQQVFADADALCVTHFERFIGRPAATSRYGIYRFVPSESTWPRDDRRVVCAVYDPEGAALTGSLEGADR